MTEVDKSPTGVTVTMELSSTFTVVIEPSVLIAVYEFPSVMVVAPESATDTISPLANVLTTS